MFIDTYSFTIIYTISVQKKQEMSAVKNNHMIQDLLESKGVKQYGFVDQNRYDEKAPLGHRLKDHLPSARSALVFLLPISSAVVDRFPTTYQGTHYHAYEREKRKISDQLHAIGEMLADFFRDHGFDALDVPKGSQNYRAILSLKHLAVYAGLGILGKNSLLINPLYGPRLRIGAVITAFTPSTFGSGDYKKICGTCRRCIIACPAGALRIPQRGQSYRISVETCHAWYCKMRKMEYRVENADVNCGLCMKACPLGTHH
jgi:epoxyqueuosine reductase QueG